MAIFRLPTKRPHGGGLFFHESTTCAPKPICLIGLNVSWALTTISQSFHNFCGFAGRKPAHNSYGGLAMGSLRLPA
jgi:hypothetical protein